MTKFALVAVLFFSLFSIVYSAEKNDAEIMFDLFEHNNKTEDGWKCTPGDEIACIEDKAVLYGAKWDAIFPWKLMRTVGEISQKKTITYIFEGDDFASIFLEAKKRFSSGGKKGWNCKKRLFMISEFFPKDADVATLTRMCEEDVYIRRKIGNDNYFKYWMYVRGLAEITVRNRKEK